MAGQDGGPEVEDSRRPRPRPRPTGGGPPRVVFVVLDAFPNHRLDADITPNLFALGQEGGRRLDGGLAHLTAATYPNHASFVTGRTPVELGMLTNRVLLDGCWQLASRRGPGATTIFELVAAAGKSSTAVVGDQYLIGVCGAHAADRHWPLGGLLAEDVARNAGGYAADEAVIEAASSLGLDTDFVFVQLDSVDSVRHMHGAESDESVEACRLVDERVGELIDLLGSEWERTVMCVVSDHDQEDVAADRGIDLAATLDGHADVQTQGTAAVVLGPIQRARLLAIDGVLGAVSLDPDHHVVWGEPGSWFGRRALPIAADHGSPRTRTQLALVGGGHPRVGAVSEWLAASRPTSSSWLPLVRDLLDV